MAASVKFVSAFFSALNDPRRKDRAQILHEFITFSLKNGLDNRRYIYSLLYRKEVENYLDYLSNKKYLRLRKLVRRTEMLPIFRNKLLFQQFFKRKGLFLPKYLGHVESGVLVTADGDVVPLSSASALEAGLGPLAEGGGGAVFAKPLWQLGGIGAVKVTAETDWKSFFKAVTTNDYIFQENVAQHPEVARVYPDALNTLRVTTCIPADGGVRIACARMRFGRGGNHVDNGTLGGFFAGVDLESGRLCTDGLTTLQRSGGRVEFFELHPDTGVPIKGFLLPGFAAALDVARRAAEALPYPLVGWDIGFTPDGPVLTEGNSGPDYAGDEVASGPYATNPVLGPFIDELTGGRGL